MKCKKALENSSVGMVGPHMLLNSKTVESDQDEDSKQLIPLALVDGINKKGLALELNKPDNEKMIVLPNETIMTSFYLHLADYYKNSFPAHAGGINFHPIKTLYIDDLCVDEKYRRQHIGESLMKHIEELARNNRFYNITLNVWKCNPNAKVFYERMGMSVLKTGMEKIISQTSDKNE